MDGDTSGNGPRADPLHHHEHSPPDQSFLEGIEGLEQHTLRSVGIDIGSSTSHLAMSTLVIQRLGSALSSEFVVAKREVVYRSPIWLTPFRPDGRKIDIKRLRSLFEEAYRAAGISPQDVDTGAVVITGEALKKENAEPIARMISTWSGRFICVSAGPHHEALLAAHGSGSVALSDNLSGRDPQEGEGSTVVNVDIGGGTTKICVVSNGAVTHSRAFSVGARLLAFDDDGHIIRSEEPARVLLGRLGLAAGVGDVLGPADRERIAGLMSEIVIGALTGETGTADLYEQLLVSTDGRPMPKPRSVGRLVFSGGVSEFLGETPPRGFGDLGNELGRALRAKIADSSFAGKVHPATQRIRATVLGAGQFTTQASGQTCYVPDPGVLPVTGLRAVRLDFRVDLSEDVIRSALRQHDLHAWHGKLAAVPSFGSVVDYRTLRRVAGLLAAVAGEQRPNPTLFVVLRHDLAHSLGTLLVEEAGYAGPVLVVDGITVGDLDHIDIGAPLGRSGSLPVTVTSLEFPHSEAAHLAVPSCDRA